MKRENKNLKMSIIGFAKVVFICKKSTIVERFGRRR
jgi:hypothetical protein